MKEKRQIQICSITIDTEKIGYEGMAYLLMTGSPGNSLSNAMDKIKEVENIIIATNAIGDYEGYAVLVFKNATELFEKVQKIKSMPEIGKIELCYTTPVPKDVPNNWKKALI